MDLTETAEIPAFDLPCHNGSENVVTRESRWERFDSDAELAAYVSNDNMDETYTELPAIVG